MLAGLGGWPLAQGCGHELALEAQNEDIDRAEQPLGQCQSHIWLTDLGAEAGTGLEAGGSPEGRQPQGNLYQTLCNTFPTRPRRSGTTTSSTACSWG